MAFARQLLIYGIGGAASRLAAIVLVPLYTRALPVEDYGRLETLLALQALAVLTVGLQAESALARDFHEARGAGWDGRLVWGSMTIVGLGSLALALIGVAGWASGTIPAGIAPFLPLVALAAIPAQVLALQLLVIRFSGAASLFGFIAFLDLVSAALFSFGFIVIGGMGIAGALLGIMAGKLACLAIAWPFTFARLRVQKPGCVLVKAMLGYAMPTLPAVFLNWLQSNGSRLLLAIFLSFTGVAITGIALKVAALYAFLAYSFRLAWEPISFQMLASEDTRPGDFNAALESYAVVMLLLAGLATSVAPLVVALFAPAEYATAAPLAGLFIIGQFWIGAMPILVIGIHGARRTSLLTPVYLAGAIVNVAAIVVLAPRFGILAAAIGGFGGGLAGALLAARSSQAHYPVQFSSRLIGVTVMTSTALAMISYVAYRGPAGLAAGPVAFVPAMAGVAAATVTAVALTAMLGLDRVGRRAMWTRLSPGSLLRRAA